MIWEARLAFILLFFLFWCIVGIIPWVVSTVVVRGRGSLAALPLAMAGASAAGILVPALGLRDFSGLLLSLLTALFGGSAGSIGGTIIGRKIAQGRPVPPRPAASHVLGSRRPEPAPPSSAPPPTSKQS